MGRPKKQKDGSKTRTVNLNVPTEFLEKIDFVLEKRILKIPRHAWILEAMMTKLKEELKAVESGEPL